MQKTPAVTNALHWLQESGFISAQESGVVRRMFAPDFEFAEALRAADSIHVHIRVDDTDELPHLAFQGQRASLDHGQPGYIKYCFPDGLNVIFSSIPVAQDNLAETEGNRRPRPHVDHLGIDLRRETEEVKHRFDGVPEKAEELHWGHIPQGGKGRPVYCCHIEVAAKHWVYPEGPRGSGIPLEFAFGPLKSHGVNAGCDLRPSSPVLHLAAEAKAQCCA